jgi:hypothetical protein
MVALKRRQPKTKTSKEEISRTWFGHPKSMNPKAAVMKVLQAPTNCQ